MKKVFREIVSWSMYILSAIFFVLILNAFIFQPTQVQGVSMEATLQNKDRLIINKLPHTFNSSYDYEDIVVIDSRVERPRSIKDDLTFNFRNNVITLYLTGKQDDFYWIKRIIGKEGDIIEFKDDKVFRNGEELVEDYTNGPAKYNIEDAIVVPEGYVFVMGDNRNRSEDSRHIGPVPVDHIVGKYWIKIN
jgi:signal peptidase I